jgi:hypothetical protein
LQIGSDCFLQARNHGFLEAMHWGYHGILRDLATAGISPANRSGFWGWNVLNRWHASFSRFLPCGKASSNPITQKQTDHPHFSTEMGGVKPFPNWSFQAGKYFASL